MVIIENDFQREVITSKLSYQEVNPDKFIGFEYLDAGNSFQTKKNIISLGYSDKVVYFETNIKNNTSVAKDLILFIDRAVAQKALYQVARKNPPYSNVSVNYLNDLPGIPLKFALEPFQEVRFQVLLDCEGLSNTFPVELYNYETFLDVTYKKSIVSSIHTGAMALLILVLLFYGTLSKYKYFVSFAWYALAYVTANALISDGLNFFFEGAVFPNIILMLFFVDATMFSLLNFIKKFFYPTQLEQYFFIKLFSVIQFLSVIHFVVSFSGLVEMYVAVKAINYLTVFAVLSVVVFLFKMNNNYLNYGKRNIFLLGFSLIFVDVLFYALYFLGYVESSIQLDIIHKLFLGGHFVMIAFVLLNMFQEKQFHYRNLAIVRLQKLNEAIIENRKELEVKVKERTFAIFERNRIIDEQKRKIEVKNVELTKAYHEAKENAKSKEDFLANMSHEIRTPLNGILGILDVFDRNNLTTKQSNQINILKNSSESLYEIINDILTISKINAKKLAVNPVDFNLENALKNSYNLFLSKAELKGLKLIMELDEALPARVRQDITKLNQILNNLLSNAIKFTEKGKVILRVYPQKNGRIRFEVEDTGKGIEPHLAPKLFDKFYQLKEDEQKLTGTGLGLSICKELTELMKGEIGVDTIAKGALFYFELPFEKAKQETSNDLSKNVSFNQLKYHNVLVVEDIILNQQVMKTLLDQFDLSYSFANNGEEAIHKIEKNNFDLVFMDIRMPVMNGIDATRILREEKHFKNAIIALSANEGESKKDYYRSIGFTDYMEKPIRLAQLKALLFDKKEEHQNQTPQNFSVVKEEVYNQFKESDSLFIYQSASDGFIELVGLFENLDQTNLNELKELIHAQKGVSGMIGAEELFEILVQMNKLLHNNDHINKSLIDSFIQALDRYHAFVDSIDVVN